MAAEVFTVAWLLSYAARCLGMRLPWRAVLLKLARLFRDWMTDEFFRFMARYRRPRE
jgi:hypothetical protein